MPARVLTGSRIRDRRLVRGLKQADLAASVGISPSYLNLIEHNKRRIGGKLLGDIARVLGADASALSEGTETRLLVGLRAAASAAAETVPVPELDRTEDFAGRFPGWAATVATQHRRIEALERTVETLTDRLTHDPYLSASMHEVLSTVTAIRSTASILAEPGEIDANWQARFHKNIHEDARRLSESAEALVRYLDDAGDAERSLTSPQEELETWLEAAGYHVPALEGGDDADIDRMVAAERGFTTDAARQLARDWLTAYRVDAQALPLVDFASAAAEGLDPAQLAARFNVPLPQVLRRLATLPAKSEAQAIGLVVCDGSGSLTFRKPVPGFQLPRFGAACPIWPLYQALMRPAVPIRAIVEQAGREARRFTAFAYADPQHPEGFGGAVTVTAFMLMVPDSGQTDGSALEVGQNCRICSKQACVARREPSILSDGV